MKNKVLSIFMFLSGILFLTGFSESKAQDYFVQLIQPNVSGIEVVAGSDFMISWTDNLSQPVDILLSDDNGASFNITLAEDVIGSTWLWNTATVPDPPLGTGTTYRIKVASSIDPSVNDFSENPFAIVNQANPSIRVIQPNLTGIKWARGNTYTISWTDNVTGDVSVDLYKGNSFKYNIYTGSETTCTWTIPSDKQLGTNYKIRVSQGSVFDASDHYFKITKTTGGTIDVLQPDGGEIWDQGSTHLISWTDNLIEPVRIELYKNGSRVKTIATSATGSTLWWTIPANYPIGTDYQIRIRSTVDASIENFSEGDFEICLKESNGYIEVIQPNGGEQWLQGTTHLISWTDNLSGKVDIYYVDNVGNETLILDNVTGSTYSWNIPSGLATGNYKINIKSSDNPDDVSDDSEDYFSIIDVAPGGSITVIQPSVSGIKWVRGNAYMISWTDNVPEVKVDLYKGNTYKSTLYTGGETTYMWDIPVDQAIGTNYKIKLISTSDNTILGVSEHPFEIVKYDPNGFIEVIQPNGGENWKLGSTYTISWTENITESVKIQLHNSGGLYKNIATVDGETTYLWTINVNWAAGSDYRIVIKSSLNNSVIDESDEVFTISTPLMFSVHPNPANQNMTLDLTKMDTQGIVDVILYNQVNMPVKQQKANSGDVVQINTANLPNGIYFLMVKSDKEIKSQKVVIQH